MKLKKIRNPEKNLSKPRLTPLSRNQGYKIGITP